MKDDDDDFTPNFKKQKEKEEEIVDFEPVEENLDEKIDRAIKNNNGKPSFKPTIKPKVDKGEDSIDKKFKTSSNRVGFAHEIKEHPPEPDYMKVDVPPGIYSIDLNIDAHWWFTHVCTVFPLLLDQAKRTHIDIKDSFKPERRLPDFNY